ncbi:MAG: chemotaxis protein CheW [Phycisphaerales bacterium]
MNDVVPGRAATTSCCTFRLEQRLYGIVVAQVREISPLLAVTTVPQAPAAVCGLVNLRSRIHLILDPRPLLGLASVGSTAESRLLILKPDVAKDVGLLVERGGDIVHVPSDRIEVATGVADSPAHAAPHLVGGVCKLDAELMMILDPTQLVDAVSRLFRHGGAMPTTTTLETIT